MQHKTFEFPRNDRKILALGAELKSTFCAVAGETAYLSETFDDLKQFDNFRAYRDAIAEFMREKDFRPGVVVADLHPNYLSTQFGREIAGGALVQVAHHFAHAAACMADNGIETPVLGVSFDGSGYGIDGDFWGGEFVAGGPSDFRRAAHLRCVPLPGADKAAAEPYRMAVSYLYDAFGDSLPDTPAVREIGQAKIAPLLAMMKKRINSPLSSSIGRLFDAVASLLRLCDLNETEAQAAIALQKIADAAVEETYDFDIVRENDCRIVDPRPIIRRIVDDIGAGVPKEKISGKFHATVAAVIARTIRLLSRETGVRTVVLAGGVFLNGVLKSGTDALLRAAGLEAFFHKNAPTGDASISLGQAYMAATHK